MTSRHLTLVTFLMLTALIVVGQLYLTIPLSEDIAELFGTDLSAAAWAGTAFGLAYAAGFLVWGPLSDRCGRRVILLCGLVATTVATALLGMAGSLGWFLAGRALQGFVASSFPPVALSLVGEALPPERRPLGVSLISFAFLAAAPVAQFVGVTLTASPTGLMLGLAPLYLVMAAGLALALPAGAGGAVGGAVPAEGRMASLLANPVVVTGWLAALSVLFGFVAFQAGTAMEVGGGFDPQVVRLVGLPPLALSLVAAPLSKRWGAPVTARTGLIISAAGLVLAGTGGPLTVAAAALVAGGVGLAVPGLIATLGGAASDHNRGLALSIYTFSLFVGASLASPVATALASAGPALLYGLPAVLLVAAAGGITLGLGRQRASRATQAT